MKFLCDQMLGSLAIWLRILGFDTYYATQEITDEELLKIAQTEQRTLISRDKELLIRAKKANIPFIGLKTTNLDEQLRIIIQQSAFDRTQVLSRCTLCNTPLKSIEKNEIKIKVPIKVFERHESFWMCPHCKKVYWMGSHYDNILKKLQDFTLAKL